MSASSSFRSTVRRAGPVYIAGIHQLAADHSWSFLTTSALNEIVLEGERSCSGARRHPELGEDVLDVPRDRVLADDEHRGDLAIALPRCYEPQHLELAAREAVRVRLTGGEPCEVRCRTEAFEDAARCVELQCGLSSSPSMRHASPTSTRVRAISYGASRASQVSPARRSSTSADSASPLRGALRLGHGRRARRASHSRSFARAPVTRCKPDWRSRYRRQRA